MDDLSPRESFFFLGIGGYGMRALAEICMDLGHSIGGYDATQSSNTEALKARGVPIDHHVSDTSLADYNYVVYSTAIQAQHPLRIKAKNEGKSLLHRNELLLRLMEGKYKILVCGTHGKTSTTAMIGHMLQELGLSPTVYVGGVVKQYQRCAWSGAGKIFVAEIDESDGSILEHHADLAIVTNIDQDHLDFYGSMQSVIDAYLKFMGQTEAENGYNILGWNSQIMRDIFPRIKSQTLTYGDILGSEVRALNIIVYEARMSFMAVVEKQQIPVEIPGIGRHTCLNALAALATGRCLELDMHACSKALASFHGVHRRHSLIYQSDKIWVIDDYAHNPGKIQSSIAAVRGSWPKAKLWVVFEPHRYSRVGALMDQFAASFTQAHKVYVTQVYASGEAKVSDLGQSMLSQEIKKSSLTEVEAFADLEQLHSDLKQQGNQDTVLLFLGAGVSTHLAHDFAEIMR
jgi:UDP-N-acetylmuramate--alanine ligase